MLQEIQKRMNLVCNIHFQSERIDPFTRGLCCLSSHVTAKGEPKGFGFHAIRGGNGKEGGSPGAGNFSVGAFIRLHY
jgi:hypothetical protein